MYERYFGLREKPFKLVPDPEYLYLSPSHAKALSQLGYAMENGDGFALVTGEVGTGKTTLCRYFLDGLDSHFSSAYIFNTQLEGTQLLAGICHEFGIALPVRGSGQSGKSTTNAAILSIRDNAFQFLLQTLNEFLIDQHRQGRKVVLLIDEAQNLSIESLEMVRMLSNLETIRHKLLHIVLVGQPELADKLATHGLRQLSQRIAIRCRLTWLNTGQTRAFIEYRLQVASTSPCQLFTPGACRAIHRFAQGIPRRINIAANRSLLLAFHRQLGVVTAHIAREAIKDLNADAVTPIKSNPKRMVAFGGISVILAVIVVYLIMAKGGPLIARPSFPVSGDTLSSAHLAEPVGPVTETIPLDNHEIRMQRYKVPVGGETRVATHRDEPPLPTVESVTVPTLAETISHLDSSQSRTKALTHMLSLWHQPKPNPAQLPESMGNERYFLVAALQYGMRLLVVQDDWALVNRLNLPVVLTIGPDSRGDTLFATLTQWQGDRVRLVIGDMDAGMVDLAQVQALAGDQFYVFWNDIFGVDTVISRTSRGEAVTVVKGLLKKIGYDHLPAGPIFDPPTYHAIVDFQMSQGIEPDGYIGPVTKILLLQTSHALELPRLHTSNGPGAETESDS